MNQGDSSFRVHIVSNPEDWNTELLEDRLAPSIQLSFKDEEPGNDKFKVLVAGRPDDALLELSPELERVIIPWAGLATETRRVLLSHPHVAVHNLHHNAEATAELGLALLLAAAKRLLPMDRSLRQGDWRPRYHGPYGVLLDGSRALVVGYGHIGRRMAQYCQALGMEVRATRRSIKEPYREEGVFIEPAEVLGRLLRSTDVLILCAPLTNETRGMIGAGEFARMPEDGILINVGRGDLVDPWALYSALEDGSLRAAGLDVWYQYPGKDDEQSETWPSEAPFWELENVVMSPHRGGMIDGTKHQRTEALIELLNQAAAGEEPGNLVDVERGY
ncbi:MAG: NAD(P)-dependent oxidoreductase [Anaerolineales bacterium]